MRSKWADIDGPVHYADFGGTGRPLVLLHGLGGSYVEWLLLAPRLAKRFRVLAPDFVGFGRTPIKHRRATLDANQRLADLFLAKVVKAPAIVVGHSMGGLIAMLQAGRNPESVSELVLIDPAMPPAGKEVTPVIPKRLMNLIENSPLLGNLAGLLAARITSPRGLVESALKRAVVDFDSLDQGLVDGLVAIEEERIRAGQPYVGYTEARMSLGEIYRDLPSFDRQVVAPITAPTMLIYGGSDLVVQRIAINRVAKKRPDWTLRVIDDVGHDPNMEVPDRVTELILEHLKLAAAS